MSQSLNPSDSPNSSDQRIAYALLRATIGLNLTMHGVSRIAAGTGEFAAKLVTQFSHAPLPSWSVWAFGLSLPPMEALLGVLLFLGLRTRATLIAASILLMVLTFGSTLTQDWTAAGIQLTYAAVYSALIFLNRYNGFSLDSRLSISQSEPISQTPEN